MKDIVGQEIKLGSYVVFAAPQGSSADLTIGRIRSFTRIKDYHEKNSGALIVTVSKYDSKYTGQSRVKMYNKILVLSEDQIPPQLRKNLDEAYERKTADERSVSRRRVRKG